MTFSWRQQDSVRREMEAGWQSPSPQTILPTYNPESDPFCPVGVARRFNQLQREVTANGSQSLIELRSRDVNCTSNRKSTRVGRRRQRPKSSGGRMTTSSRSSTGQVAPVLAGATLQLQEGGGFTSVRGPPLRGKGLPSGAQINAGLSRSAKDRMLALKSRLAHGRDPQDPRHQNPGESSGETEEAFAAKVSKRDDVLQDLWLKMHSGEGFLRVQRDITRLLVLYRSSTLGVIEDVMRHPQLKSIADGHAKRKGEGMRSFHESVAQDADFADGIPEAVSWLGFSSRRNPLFLPPRKGDNFTSHRNQNLAASDSNDGNADNKEKNDSDIGLEGVDVARLWDAQDFILLGDDENAQSSTLRLENSAESGGEGRNDWRNRSGDRTRELGAMVGKNHPPGKLGLRTTARSRTLAINGQLAAGQESIRNLEESLRVLEPEREKGRARAARARKAAEEAGLQKQAQKMYRLRGAAAFLEEELEELSSEITAVRVRLFAERQEVSRKRHLKDALASEAAAKARARRRRASKRTEKAAAALITARRDDTVPSGASSQAADNDVQLDRQHHGAAAIQARVRGARARAEVYDMRDRSRREKAATRIEAAVRGRLVRQSAPAMVSTDSARPTLSRGNGDEGSVPFSAEGEAATPNTRCTKEASSADEHQTSTTVVSRDIGACSYQGPECGVAGNVLTFKNMESTAVATVERLASIEALGVDGVRAFFESIGLGAYAGSLRRPQGRPTHTQRNEMHTAGDRGEQHHVSYRPEQRIGAGGGIDGIDLAHIMRAKDGDAELLALGVSARLHRIKILSALGIQPLDDYQPPSGIHNSGGLPRSPVAGVASVHMVRRILREQKVVSDALRNATRRLSLFSSEITRATDGPSGGREDGLHHAGERTHGESAQDVANGECIRLEGLSATLTSAVECVNAREQQRTTVRLHAHDDPMLGGGEGSTYLVPVRLLLELEDAVGAQAALTRQALEMLDHAAPECP